MKALLMAAAFSALGLMVGNANASSPYPMCCSAKDTTGWALMSADERNAHRQKMMEVKTYDGCKAMHDEHRKLMETRAKELGKNLPPLKSNMCDHMKDRGVLK